jgi:hypothetical protein
LATELFAYILSCFDLSHFRRELETHLIPDLANITREYLLGPLPRGDKLSLKEKARVFGVSAAAQHKAQQWYIARAHEIHQWPQRLHELQWWNPSLDEAELVPFDEHAFHSSADEAECSQRQMEDAAEHDAFAVAVLPAEGVQAAGEAAAPTLDAPVAMELDD